MASSACRWAPRMKLSAIDVDLQSRAETPLSALQAAIDTELLRLPASGEAAMGPMFAANASTRPSEPQSWTQWGTAMPSGSYVHNNFYQASAATPALQP